MKLKNVETEKLSKDSKPSRSSRIILKHLPKYATEDLIRREFVKNGLRLTDISIIRKNDESRRICFVGLISEDEAEHAIKQFDNSYVDTCRILASYAWPAGHSELPRPWSAHSRGSSAYERKLSKQLRLQNKNTKSTKTTQNSKVPSSGIVDASKPVKRGQKKKNNSSGKLENLVKKKDLLGDENENLRNTVSDESNPIGRKPKQSKNITDEQLKRLADHGRLYMTNIPYITNETDLCGLCKNYGAVSEIHIPVNQISGRNRGFAYVTFAFPEDAVSALSSLQGHIFQGRLLSVCPADEKKLETDNPNSQEMKRTSSYKKIHEQRKQEAAEHPRIWNLLFVSSNAAVDVISQQLGLEKHELLDLDSDDLAVRVSLGETKVIQQMRAWLEEEGINMKAFERPSSDPLCESRSSVPRLLDTIIVKHLPAETIAEELQEIFRHFGNLRRFCMAPSKTVAIVQYTSEKDASRAFTKIAFRPYQSVPMYLEWAPHDVFSKTKKISTVTSAVCTVDKSTNDAEQSGLALNVEDNGEITDIDKEESTQDLDDSHVLPLLSTSVFIKNLNFITTEAQIADTFKKCNGFRCATLKTMKSPQMFGKESDDCEPKSMGYGYVEFDSHENAIEAMKRMKETLIDGHAVVLELSRSNQSAKLIKPLRSFVGTSRKESKNSPSQDKKSGSTHKLLIKNVAFQSTKKELKKLFESCGNVVAVRIPKSATKQNRGYAFVEFVTVNDAQRAMELLQHTHFYGRHLIIEPGFDLEETVENAREKLIRQNHRSTNQPELKKRRIIE